MSKGRDRKRKAAEALGEGAIRREKGEGECDDISTKFNCFVERQSISTSPVGVAERKITRLKVGKGDCMIGLASGGTPFWFWAVSSLGHVRWIDTPEERVSREETGSASWAKLAISRENRLSRNKGTKKSRVTIRQPQSWEDRPEVDVVLFDGGWSPNPGHPVWKLPAVQVVCWIGG